MVIGQGRKSTQAYLIDLSQAKRFICPTSGTHIKARSNKGLIRESKFASVNAHLGKEASRRDDLESLIYILIYFSSGGELPWA